MYICIYIYICVHAYTAYINVLAYVHAAWDLNRNIPRCPSLAMPKCPVLAVRASCQRHFLSDCRCGNIRPNPENAHLQLRDRPIPDADAQCCGQVVGLVGGTSPCHACPSTDLDVRLVYFYDGHTDRCTHIGRHQQSSQHPCELSSRLTDLSRIKTQLLKDGGRIKVLTDIHWITVR